MPHRQVKFSHTHHVKLRIWLDKNTKPIQMDGIECKTDDGTIFDCNYGVKEQKCGHSNIAWLHCCDFRKSQILLLYMFENEIEIRNLESHFQGFVINFLSSYIVNGTAITKILYNKM